jgi:oligopeptide transport system substrate-binding protein
MSETDAADSIFRMAITEPTAIDPYRAQEIEGIGVTKQLFVGLLQIDQRQRLAPAVAQAWGSDETGTVWTFSLRQDVRFSNGEQVDAERFVHGVTRALDPAAATETAYHVAGVRGFAELRSGATTTLAGVSAPDQWTVVFELGTSDFEFDKKVVQPIFSPVPASAGAALNPEFNDFPIGNGPYALVEPWQHGKSITLRRNPYWFGETPAVAEVHIDIIGSKSSLEDEFAGFRQGRYDYARVPGELVGSAWSTYSKTGGFVERDLPGLHYLIPFCHQAPMDSVWARRAISCAIDRVRIASELFSGARTPAGSLISPWFSDVYAPQLGAPYTDYDPDLARKCAAMAGLVGTIDLAFNEGAGHDAWVLAIAEQIHSCLGLDVRLIRTNNAELVAYRTSAAATGLCRAGWAYDYPTPDNLLYPLLHSSCTAPDAEGAAHGDNEGRYVNPNFDAAVDIARSTQDGALRAGRWRDAERIAVEDLALIPLWYRTEYRVFAADRFANLDLDFFGNPTLAALRPIQHTETGE